jgi:PadR family transcriptional regulator, regulatory protein PadR
MAFTVWASHRSLWGETVGEKTDVWQGTLALMVLKTLQALGPLHGYGIARRIEQTSGDLLAVNYGTLYPALLKLEQEGYISSEWGMSDNNRKAKYYKLTRAGRKQLEREAREWEQTTEILARFLSPEKESA